MTIYILAIVLSALFSIALGTVWYSPLLFGKIWMKELGIQKPETITPVIRRQMITGYVTQTITLIVSVFGLAILLGSFLPATLFDSIKIGAFIWFFFIITTSVQSVIWENKSWKSFFINAGYHLVSVTGTMTILFLMLMR